MVVKAEVSRVLVNPITIGTIRSAASIKRPWKKSVQHTALKPPRNV